jgi:hypothetical protein
MAGKGAVMVPEKTMRSHDDQGSVLIASVLLTLLMASLAMGLVSLSSMQGKASHALNKNLVCRYAAEAALADARFLLSRDDAYESNTWFTAFEGATDSVTPRTYPSTNTISPDRAQVDFELYDATEASSEFGLVLGSDEHLLQARATLDTASHTLHLRFKYTVVDETTTVDTVNPTNSFSRYNLFLNEWLRGVAFQEEYYNGPVHCNESMGFSDRDARFYGEVTAVDGFTWYVSTSSAQRAAMFPAGYDDSADYVDMPEYADIDTDLLDVAQSGPPEQYISTNSSAYSSMGEITDTEIAFVFDPSTGRSKGIITVHGTHATRTTTQTTTTTTWTLVPDGSRYRFYVYGSTRTRNPEVSDPSHRYRWYLHTNGYYYRYYRSNSRAPRRQRLKWAATTTTTTETAPEPVTIVNEIDIPNDGSGMLIYSEPRISSLKGVLCGRVTVTTPYLGNYNSRDSNYAGLKTYGGKEPAVTITDDLVYVDQDGDPAWWVYDKNSSAGSTTTSDLDGVNYSYKPLEASGRTIATSGSTTYTYSFPTTTSTDITSNVNSRYYNGTDVTWEASYVHNESGERFYYGPNARYNPANSTVLGILVNGDVLLGKTSKFNSLQHWAMYSSSGKYRDYLYSDGSYKGNMGFLGSTVCYEVPLDARSGSLGHYRALHRMYDDRLMTDAAPPYWIPVETTTTTTTTTQITLSAGWAVFDATRHN